MNLHRNLLVVLMAITGACAPQVATQASDQTSVSDPASAKAADGLGRDGDRILSEAELVGAYRIAGFDGEDLDAPFGAALTIGSGMVTFEAQCATYSWQFSIVDRAITLVPDSKPSAQCLNSGELHPKVAQIARAIGETRLAARTPSNAIRLSGSGRSVTVFTQ